MGKTKNITKQIIFGIVFGIVAIIETEFGVKISGATINVRDCPVVCAGLVFGGPAGIIAGVIGGVERWFSVYWGIGAYSRVACTLGTMFAGVFAAFVRKYIYDDHIPQSIHALVIGVVVEVFHLLLLFVTHVDESLEAFEVLKACSIPMIVANAFGTFASITIVNVIRKEFKKGKDKSKLTIDQLFQRRLLAVVLISFLITNGFSIFIQFESAKKNTDQLLILNINDIKGSAESLSDSHLMRITNQIVQDINKMPLYELKKKDLMQLCYQYNISEINIINEDGIIFLTTNDNYQGFDMKSGEQALDFYRNVNLYNSYVQPFVPTTYNEMVYMKYAGAILKNGNIIQVGYDSEQFYNDIDEDINLLALNRHVGKKGHVIVAKMNGDIVSDYYGSKNSSLMKIGLNDDLSKKKEYTLYEGNFYGEKSFYEFVISESYYLIATQPKDETLQAEEMSMYLTTFTEILTFAGIFILGFFVIKKTVVNNIKDINKSLKKITNGNLDVVVDVRKNAEFDSLSTGINDTVGKMKDLITEAKERNRKELEYAAEIQRSALPSTFPAFPDHNEIDIYASMDPAKEVGGDFYDFYFVGDNKLAILIADVSGKGVPASLFMMRAKTIIKSYAEYGIAVNDVFTNVNFNLCEGNDAGLFVTAWMGIIDLKNGHMTYANAGHNPPLIKKKDGTFEYLKARPGFVLGGMEGIAYKIQEIDLEPGSEIFLYTDGLTEAQNINQELYGEERLYEAINSFSEGTSQEICLYVKAEVDKFVGEADQFDDLTMLDLKFIKRTFD